MSGNRNGPTSRARIGFHILCFLLVLFLGQFSPAHAADDASEFEQANKLYEQGKYADAASAYDKILQSSHESEAVYFNRGNAYLKLGELGRAIASYRQAEELSPRDPDLRANLQFARTQARGGTVYRANRWEQWLGWLTLNEWTILTAVAFWIFFSLLILKQWKPQLKTRLRNPTWIAGLAMVFLGIGLIARVNASYYNNSAIVIAGEADVRHGPLDESQTAYKVRDGVELSVLDQKDGWFRVSDSSGRSGWLRQDQLLLLQPTAPQKSKA